MRDSPLLQVPAADDVPAGEGLPYMAQVEDRGYLFPQLAVSNRSAFWASESRET